jgi:Holliday junction resolvase RusA-like endonuclease
MSVVIEFPVEFVVEGTPVSLQAKERRSIEQWKSQIILASRSVLPEGHFATEVPLTVTLFYFTPVPMEGDLDNIVKPILDALERHIYIDDHQIHRIVVQKFEAETVRFASPSPTLRQALNTSKRVLYVRLSDDPYEDFAR